MAEYGAHLATNLAQKPSIFEVLAQENLARALRNALRHLISYFADLRSGKRPRRSWLKAHRDELVTLADLSVQLYHLARYASSFSEHFYGLRRVASTTGDAALKRSHVLKSLASLVLLPYVRAKLDALVFDEEPRGESEGWIGKLRRVYPAISLACEAASLSFALFYAVGKSSVHSPTLSLSSVHLEVAPTVPVPPDPNAGRAVRVLRGVADAFSASLATAAFLLHFLDWWNSQRKGSLVAEPPVPAPPLSDERSEPSDGAAAPQSLMRRGHCPLCLKEIAARAAVLTTSGYVFCYDCIRAHLSSGRTTCPVTGYPSSHENVVLLVGQ
ncbi:peroxisome assembly protein 12-like [Dermacentor variabilis]|uniref:peroxisome assembly protein 12-like n=1 Tax=Dermacentor variabilis TaxID=34621 RepID=UPI003F5BA01F